MTAGGVGEQGTGDPERAALGSLWRSPRAPETEPPWVYVGAGWFARPDYEDDNSDVNRAHIGNARASHFVPAVSS